MTERAKHIKESMILNRKWKHISAAISRGHVEVLVDTLDGNNAVLRMVHKYDGFESSTYLPCRLARQGTEQWTEEDRAIIQEGIRR